MLNVFYDIFGRGCLQIHWQIMLVISYRSSYIFVNIQYLEATECIVHWIFAWTTNLSQLERMHRYISGFWAHIQVFLARNRIQYIYIYTRIYSIPLHLLKLWHAGWVFMRRFRLFLGLCNFCSFSFSSCQLC